jgi:hypothetical protein
LVSHPSQQRLASWRFFSSRWVWRYRFSTPPAHSSIQLCAVDDDARPPPPSTTARGSSRPRPKRLRTPWSHRHRWQDSGRGRFTVEEDGGGAREGRGTPQGRHGYWWRPCPGCLITPSFPRRTNHNPRSPPSARPTDAPPDLGSQATLPQAGVTGQCATVRVQYIHYLGRYGSCVATM